MFTVNGLPAAFVGNFISVILVLMMLFTKHWAVFRNKEYSLLKYILIITLVCSVLDPLVYTIDGRGALVSKITIFLGNSILYFSNSVTGYLWVLFLSRHMNAPLSKLNKCFMRIIFIICSVAVVVNAFYPIVFTIDSANVYHRTGVFYLYVMSALLYIVDSVILYFKVRESSGRLKMFPIWAFIMPIVAAIIVQSIFYGVSVVWPCVAVSVVGVASSLQNEIIFRDNLTGLFNRSYLDSIRVIMPKTTGKYVTGIMADINRFKSINDTYGHSAGDEALLAVSDVFKNAVGDLGIVIRYAGDEFVMLLNTTDDVIANACVRRIHSELDKLNSSGQYPYEITVSTGSALIDIKNQSLNEFLNIIDKKMYANKAEFYRNNPMFERRSNG